MMLRLAANNLRRAALKAKVTAPSNRTMITSAQKRKLQKDQLGSTDKATATTTKAGNGVGAPTAKPPTKTVTPPPPSGGSGGGGTPLPLLAGMAAVAVGGAYYMDLIPKDLLPASSDEKVTAKVVEKEEEKPVAAAVVEKKEAEKSKVVNKEQKEDTKSDLNGNRVIQISAPSNEGRTSEPVSAIGHPEGGSRVSVEEFSALYSAKAKGSADDAVNAASSASTSSSSAPVAIEITASDAKDAEQELFASTVGRSKINEELAKAHALMKATVDETYLKDLDSLTESELKIRIVQLSSEMNERTKWEAVRLREFLGMKEKEVGETYMDKMQKQRFEFEDLLARRLREQEGNLTRAANEALLAKDKSMESVVNAAASAQQAEYEAALKGNTDILKTELSATYEAEFGAKLAEEKASMIKEMESAVSTIDNLSKRLQQAEENLQISRNFESGSQRAHRVSAAALALAEKMESSMGAGEEVAALKAASAESSVIASALEKIPSSVKAGIPTLPELQSSFDQVYDIGREAAYVPAGRNGIGAQLAGKGFASITSPPSPDSSPPEGDDESKMSDYILSRAKQHVKLGELEQSISELDKLKGQTAFTINDWKSAAMDRIAVDKALKVIKMECALLNKNMSG